MDKKQKLLDDIRSGKNTCFCAMPFLSVTAHQTGAFRLCCRDAKIVESESLGDIKNTTIEKMRNSPKMKEFRLKMLNNQEIPECKVCYESQKKGIRSARERSNNVFFKDYLEEIYQSTDFENGTTEMKVKHIDLRFSNICNLACRMCWSGSSSGRRKYDLILKRPVEEISRDIWNVKDFESIIDDLKSVYIAGGEPMIDKEFIPFLEYIVSIDRAKDILLVVNTNLTIYTEKHKKLFSHFRKIHIIVSCDGYGKSYDYIRIGAKWDIFLKNLKALKKSIPIFGDGSQVSMNTVVQIDNIYDVAKLYIFCYKLGIVINLSILELPQNMHIGIIPQHQKTQILEFYKNFISKYKDEIVTIEEDFKDIIHILNSGQEKAELYDQFLKEKDITDEYVSRNEKIEVL